MTHTLATLVVRSILDCDDYMTVRVGNRILVVAQGCVVDVHLQSGLVYEGILRTVSPHLDVALEVAHIKEKDTLVC